MDAQLEPTGTHALWDETFQKLGRSAPPQRADESMPNYQRRLAELGSHIFHAASKSLALISLSCPTRWFPNFRR